MEAEAVVVVGAKTMATIIGEPRLEARGTIHTRNSKIGVRQVIPREDIQTTTTTNNNRILGRILPASSHGEVRPDRNLPRNGIHHQVATT